MDCIGILQGGCIGILYRAKYGLYNMDCIGGGFRFFYPDIEESNGQAK